jgi:tetratricopeptide (TPR) repeat protein
MRSTDSSNGAYGITHFRWIVLGVTAAAFISSCAVGACYSWTSYNRLPGPRADSFEQANNLARMGKPLEAAALYEHFLRVDPDNIAGWYNLATLQEGLGQWDRARRSWRQALTLRSPQLAMVYGHLGICAFRLGESLTDDSQRQRFWREAYADFESARAHGATLNPQIESFMEQQRATIK